MRLKYGKYSKIAYRFFGWADANPSPSLLKTLYQADIQMTPGMFLSTIFGIAMIATPIALVTSYVIFRFFVDLPFENLIIMAIAGATFGASTGGLYFIAVNRISAKKVKINYNLPFVMSYMATLSAAGMNPVQTLRHVAMKDFGPASKEFSKIVYRFDILGEDVISAIVFVAKHTPSETLRDVLLGISNVIVSGGSLADYCDQMSKELMELKKAKIKGFIDSLAMFSEGYLGGVVVSLIMGVIGLFVMGSLGFHILPEFSTQATFDLLVFVMVPLINAVFLAMLEMKFSSGEY
jgi:flagellar protein FlaJ